MTTGTGLPWNNITFNWFSDTAATTPTAFGTLFLLSQAYTGTPDALSSATPGFIAQSQSISNGQYIFDPAVTLKPNTQYFFFANAFGDSAFGTINPLPDGNTFFSLNSSSSFSLLPTTYAAFRLSGTPIPTPTLLPGAGAWIWHCSASGRLNWLRRRKKGRTVFGFAITNFGLAILDFGLPGFN